jgi:uncharacterized SAM-binding protein YcdF (DUF218 family)
MNTKAPRTSHRLLSRIPRRLRICLLMLLSAAAVALLWFLTLMLCVFFYSFRTSDEPADAAIVLGAAVARNVPTPVFRERLLHAVTLQKQGKVKYLIFTGGIGGGDRISEASAGRNLALHEGIPDSALLLENHSRTTVENLRYAQLILGQKRLKRVLIVSDPFHMRRAMTIANDLGIDAKPSPTETTRYRTWGTKARFLMSETWNYNTYLLQNWIFGGPLETPPEEKRERGWAKAN